MKYYKWVLERKRIKIADLSDLSLENILHTKKFNVIEDQMEILLQLFGSS